jgi:hypothetical protein
VSGGFIFGGTARILSSFVYVRVCSSLILSIYANLHQHRFAVLVRWSYGALSRRLPDCPLQQVLPSSDKGGAMMVGRLRLAIVPVVVAGWSTDLDVIFIIFGLHCTAMIEDE